MGKAKPKMRKKPIEEEEPGTPYVEDIESENLPRGKMAKMMSPDSGMGDSPHGRRRDSGDSISDLTQGRRESSDLINENFENVPTSGSGPEVEELERNIPADQLIGIDTDISDPGAKQPEDLYSMIASLPVDVQFDGAIPKSIPPSANIASSSGKPKSQRPKDPLPDDTLPEAIRPRMPLHTQALHSSDLWTATKNYSVGLLVFLMLMLLRWAGERTVEGSSGPGVIFEKLISVFWPFPIFLTILCFLPNAWVSDFCTEQKILTWLLNVLLAAMLTVLSLRVFKRCEKM